MSRRTYLLHGLRVRSEIELGERLTDGEPDLEITWGQRREIPTSPPAGRLLAARDPAAGGYAIVETDAGYVIHFSGECVFRVTHDCRSVVVDTAAGFDRQLVPIVMSGNVLALLLGLQGECVLHASAVSIDGWALAIAGGSGMGKSTLAALFCSAGAELVSDDLVRIDTAGGRLRCYTGTAQIRLRPSARELADPFSLGACALTADGRFGAMPKQAAGPSVQLDAVLVPAPSRQSKRLRVRRLPKKDALIELLQHPRLHGWNEIGPIHRHFEICADIAEEVPVFKASIPWGPPFAPGLAQSLVERLRG